MIRVENCENQSVWDGFVIENNGHPLQLWGWGQVKMKHNWQVKRVFIYDDNRQIGAAQLLIRHLPWPLNALVYVPRGPVVTEQDRSGALAALEDHAKHTLHAAVVTIEPDWEGELSVQGWRKSTNTILIPRTLILDLHKTEDELMEDIHRKRRYDIRKSTQAVFAIHEAKTEDELAACLALYKETAARAGFSLHDDHYYEDIFRELGEHSRLIAVWNPEGQAIAFCWLAVTTGVAFELYGGINAEGQALRANYALKWWCITRMKAEGVQRYDFNGLLNDGISEFKKSFASHENLLVGTYDRPLSPLYFVWDQGLPLAKKLIRTLKKR